MAAAVLAATIFVGLGVWQLERRVWKHALIARVEARVGAAPAAPPPAARWPQVDAEHDEYRRLRLSGRWLPGRSARVQALTRLGPGCWLVTPLRQDDGAVVLVNRGFLAAQPEPATGTAPAPSPGPEASGRDASPCAPGHPAPEPPAGPVALTGLLRLSEPGGGFLRRNDPAADRWFSRDVAAIARARGLAPVAPFFVDADGVADAAPADPHQPVGGLTVVDFRDDHLTYALTWFALAAMAGVAAWRFGPRRAGQVGDPA